ncbi:MAG: PEP-CTERM sorting domain-containing protein, partial [Gemmatimonadota bacterium]|nr:PEP-CTERM sorting domain-containing protein [Gemmatimonadota bacterium]
VSVATAVRRMAGSAIVGGALLASSAVVAQAQVASPLPFLGTGTVVSVRYVGFNGAVDKSVLAYRVCTTPPVGTCSTTAGSYTDLFSNLNPGASVPGMQVVIGPVAAGQEVIFRLTNLAQGGGTNFTFYSGPFSRNPDGVGHVAVGPGSGTVAAGGGVYALGFNFEDRSATVPPISDQDLNDLNFEVALASTVPEPSSIALMLGGLLAVGFAARRRRAV